MIDIIFICHDEKLVQELYEKYDKHIVLFVGKNEIDSNRFSNLTIVRNLPYNIEEEKSLLTFTAWYAIIKNDLFKDHEYLCLLEYDVILKDDFQQRLDECINTFPNVDLFSFIETYTSSFKLVVFIMILLLYLLFVVIFLLFQLRSSIYFNE
jgi:hypothetical protein